MNSCPPTVLAGPVSSVYKGKYNANTLSSQFPHLLGSQRSYQVPRTSCHSSGKERGQYCTVKDNIDVQTNISYRYHFQQIQRESKYQIHRFVKHRFRLSILFKTEYLSVTALVVFRAELPGPSLYGSLDHMQVVLTLPFYTQCSVLLWYTTEESFQFSQSNVNFNHNYFNCIFCVV